LKREGIIGTSPALEACLAQVAQVAGSDVNVLITGETGTGKELFARAIHANSFRASRNFVVVDCASFPDALSNSMLFGHKKGSFTGAQKDRSGLIRDADGGTLFLDEVGELSADHQKEFLRVLQENRFRPIGSNQEVKSDFRLVAATNRDLGSMADAGMFRKDLLYRIQTFNIHLPPLKSRSQDIKDIARHWISLLCEQQRLEPKKFSPDFFDALMAYDWPGNVRELIHTLESVFTIARDDQTLFPHHLPTRVRAHLARRAVRPEKTALKNSRADSDIKAFPSLREVRESAMIAVEKQYLQDLLDHTAGDLKKAIRLSGLSQSRLYALLKKYDIPRD
jgi:two-component system NtrC family response regulator